MNTLLISRETLMPSIKKMHSYTNLLHCTISMFTNLDHRTYLYANWQEVKNEFVICCVCVACRNHLRMNVCIHISFDAQKFSITTTTQINESNPRASPYIHCVETHSTISNCSSSYICANVCLCHIYIYMNSMLCTTHTYTSYFI